MSLQPGQNALRSLQDIRDYVGLFQRAHLVPARPLSQLSWTHPLVLHGTTQYTTIRILRSQFSIKLGDAGTFTTETIVLVFTTPAILFQVPVTCGVHIPLFMWHDGATQRRGPEFLSDDREPGFQIGSSDVRMAIHSHLLARWRDLYERVPRPPRSSLFGQVLVRYYATFVSEKLRYLIFEVPNELWELNGGILSPTPTVRWSDPMGRFLLSCNNAHVYMEFVLELSRPVPRSISWRTVVAHWNAEQVDDVRNEVVARISLMTDPPISF